MDITLSCDHCKRRFKRKRSDIAHRRRQGQARFYCSNSCKAHHNSRKAKVKRYRMITFPDGTQTYEHRLKMQKKLGRKLLPHEQVHHKDHDKGNNRLSNLELTTPKKHGIAHATVSWDLKKALRLYKQGNNFPEIARQIGHPRYVDIWLVFVRRGLHKVGS